MNFEGNRSYGSVSVITATHNSADSIERCVRSVWAQTRQPMEHIVVDDGSDDRTVEILTELAREFPKLNIVRQSNLGAGPARNAGIEAATGRYVAFLDSDDAWLESKLEKQISFMEEHDSALSYGEYTIVDSESGNAIGQFEPPQRLGYRQLLTRCPIGCSTAAYNSDILGKRYMPAIQRGQDWALWLALTRDGIEARKYPGCNVIYYKRRNSLSRKKLAKAIDMYRIYRREEGIGRSLSVYLLARHAVNAMLKNL